MGNPLPHLVPTNGEGALGRRVYRCTAATRLSLILDPLPLPLSPVRGVPSWVEVAEVHPEQLQALGVRVPLLFMVPRGTAAGQPLESRPSLRQRHGQP